MDEIATIFGGRAFRFLALRHVGIKGLTIIFLWSKRNMIGGAGFSHPTVVLVGVGPPTQPANPLPVLVAGPPTTGW